MIDTILCKQLYFLILRIDQLQIIIIRKKNHAWMRIKSKQYGFAVHILRYIFQPGNDLLVTNMHTIKGSGGDNRVFNAFKIGYIMVNFQVVLLLGY